MLKDLKYIFKLMGKHKLGYFTLLPLWSIVGSLIDVSISYSLKLLTDFFIYKKEENITYLIIIFGAAFVCSGGFCILFYLHNKVKDRILRDIRIDTFREVQKLPASYFKTNHSGDMVSRFNTDTNSVTAVFGEFENVVESVIKIGITIPFILFLDVRFGAILLLFSLITGVVNAIFVKPLREKHKKTLEQRAILSKNATEAVTGFNVVKMFSLSHFLLEKFMKSVDSNYEIGWKASKLYIAQRTLNGMMWNLSAIISTILGCIYVINGTLEAGSYLAIVSGNGIGWALSSLITAWPNLQKAFAGSNRLKELYDAPKEQEFYDVPGTGSDAGIEFSDVSFTYEVKVKDKSTEIETEKNVHFRIEGLDLTIEKGKMLALVGDSGGGKSTLAKLILGLYQIDKGSITINGKAYRDYSLAELRDSMGYVPQDAYIFNGTIKENILYGKNDATDEEVQEAAKAANAHDFIIAQPQGYDTAVGERGIRLSGGQRQRIAIARAIIKDPSILLLDEATSSLDSESEELIQDALLKFMKKKTSIVIAHRLSTIVNADKICYIKDGHVQEQGTHEQLLKLNGNYRELYYREFAKV
ncbi:MAG: ABC transporter ATP-binding protein [Clostridia bacterium]